MRLISTLVFFGVSTISWAAIDWIAVEKDLTGSGLEIRLHAAAHDLRQYVVTVRDPRDFFIHEEVTLIATTPAAKATLANLNRHDKIIVKGEFADNPSPQKHILAHDIQVAEKRQSNLPPFSRTAKLPDDLRGKDKLLAVVHAVAAEGEILVIEYKDTVVPIFVDKPALAKDLYRGDKIRLHYSIQNRPGRPTHLRLDAAVDPSVVVLDSLVKQHGQPIVREGLLVKFEQSPIINRDVFALQDVDADGLKRNYTLFNADSTVFGKLMDKAAQLWAKDTSSIVNGRNCLINNKIRIRATGIGNVEVPDQANPQIILDGPDSIAGL